MSKERKQSLFIIAYKGHDTADEVYKTLRGLKKEKQVKIKTAAVVTRKKNGKLKLKHKKRLTVWKGTFSGGIIALLLVGTGGGAVLGGAMLGALLGSGYSKRRRETKKFLVDKLGQDDSALVILIKHADWEAVKEATAQYDGEALDIELTPEAEEQLKALASNKEVAEAVSEEVEAEDDADVEEVDETEEASA